MAPMGRPKQERMTDLQANEPTTAEALLPPASEGAWQALPKAARTLFMVSGSFLGLPFAIGGGVFGVAFDRAGPLALAVLGGLLAGGFGAWLGYRRYRHTRWRLDADGFSLRKGRMWQSEIRIPMNRVQHLDLRRGPLERRLGLATLVIHTAGTSHSSVNVGGLPVEDAERLRDLLARQAEHDRVDAGAVPGDGVPHADPAAPDTSP